MSRRFIVCAFWAAAALALSAQTPQSNPYTGTSNPPPDETITDSTPPPAPAAKPPAGQPAESSAFAQPQPAASGPVPAPAQANQLAVTPGQPVLDERAGTDDPDGDIVHPAPLPPGELGEGTEIRVRLLDRLSTSESRPGQTFRTRVASDVFRGNEVLIPAGAEIDGTVVESSSGHFAGHGSMLLRPETVIFPDGARYRLYAQLTGTPGSATHVSGEGTVSPDGHVKKDGIEYGAAAGTGAVTGAILGGPAGALAGTLIGAGAVTVHLMVNHPQATLEPGAALQFSLTEPLNLVLSSPQTSGAQSGPAAEPALGSQPGSDQPPTETGAQPPAAAVSQN
jgi:hypothetical protein